MYQHQNLTELSSANGVITIPVGQNLITYGGISFNNGITGDTL